MFQVGLYRGQEAAKELLSEAFAGILVTDRWGGYNWVDKARRQLCWAHLVREFRQLSERGGASQVIGERLLAVAAQMFEQWRQVRTGARPREEFVRASEAMRHEVKKCLEQGRALAAVGAPAGLSAKTARTCAELLKMEAALWTFVRIPGVEPTNNVAERMLRHVVILRKISLDSQSKEGSVFVARLLTVVMSLRLQHRNPLEFLVGAVQAKRTKTAAPSLLPGPSPASLAEAA